MLSVWQKWWIFIENLKRCFPTNIEKMWVLLYRRLEEKGQHLWVTEKEQTESSRQTIKEKEDGLNFSKVKNNACLIPNKLDLFHCCQIFTFFNLFIFYLKKNIFFFDFLNLFSNFSFQFSFFFHNFSNLSVPCSWENWRSWKIREMYLTFLKKMFAKN